MCVFLSVGLYICRGVFLNDYTSTLMLLIVETHLECQPYCLLVPKAHVNQAHSGPVESCFVYNTQYLLFIEMQNFDR